MSVTAPLGFRAAGVAAGLKPSGRPDVSLVVNDGPHHAAAGVFTRNRVQAAPVLWSREVLRGGTLRAVVLNSGGANACTGPAGFQDTHATAEAVGAALGIGAGEVAVCSTGLIGPRLPMDLLLDGVGKAVAALSAAGGADAAEAIRTTDTVAKTAHVAGAGWSAGGMAKGAAMLAPSLATMLCVLTTDAVAEGPVLQEALQGATARTFDRVDSDGCMSTNDTVLLLASGASGIRPEPADLAAAVTTLCADLAGQMIADAEGATKRIAVEVTGARSERDAVEAARAVARSALFKCAMHGADPNWGRVVAAVGTTDVDFDPGDIDVAFNGVAVCLGGVAAGRDEPARAALAGPDIHVRVDLKAGDAVATVHTTDLTADYVHLNSAYST